MVAGSIGGDTEGPGACVLRLLSAPLNAAILDELSRGARRLVELRRATGSPPQTTLRARVRELSDVGAVAKRRLHPFPSVREHVLANGAGTELRFVAGTLGLWLRAGPYGGSGLGSDQGRAAVKAFADAWSTGILRLVADRPASVEEIAAAVEGLSPSSVERRVLALAEAGLLEAGRRPGSGISYSATDWLRRAAAPLVTAIRWERKHLASITSPIGPVEAETGLLLALPLLRLPGEFSGSCRLGVELERNGQRRLAGATVRIDRGEVVACRPELDTGAQASASGAPEAWQRVAIEAHPDRLELEGDLRLVRAILDCLNQTLFPPRLI
jgi:DNA-binding HxlR family transcriptional regulator